VVLVNFAWIWPILSAVPISENMWNNELWLPSWR
jgi:dolichyl-phosphate-mannose--protein O-mannosyl transferase